MRESIADSFAGAFNVPRSRAMNSAWVITSPSIRCGRVTIQASKQNSTADLTVR